MGLALEPIMLLLPVPTDALPAAPPGAGAPLRDGDGALPAAPAAPPAAPANALPPAPPAPFNGSDAPHEFIGVGTRTPLHAGKSPMPFCTLVCSALHAALE